jgi:hypothetical protein
MYVVVDVLIDVDSESDIELERIFDAVMKTTAKISIMAGRSLDMLLSFSDLRLRYN